MSEDWLVHVTDEYGVSMEYSVTAPDEVDAASAAFSHFSEHDRERIGEPQEVNAYRSDKLPPRRYETGFSRVCTDK